MIKQILHKEYLAQDVNELLAQSHQLPDRSLPLGTRALLLFLLTFMLEQISISYFNFTTATGAVIMLIIDVLISVNIILYVRSTKLEPTRNELSFMNRWNLICSGWLAIIILIMILSQLMTLMHWHAVTSNNQAIIQQSLKTSPAGFWYIIISSVVFAPIIEEFAFRYLIIKPRGLATVTNPYIRAAISLILFVGIHVIGMSNWLDASVGYIAIALPLVYLYTRYRSLWLNATLHGLWNATALIMMFLH